MVSVKNIKSNVNLDMKQNAKSNINLRVKNDTKSINDDNKIATDNDFIDSCKRVVKNLFNNVKSNNKPINSDSESIHNDSFPNLNVPYYFSLDSLNDCFNDTKINSSEIICNTNKINNIDKNICVNDPNPRKSKPITKIRVMKASLDYILKENLPDAKIILIDAVNRVHKIIIHVYQFVRLFILNKYHNNIEIPNIDKDFIAMVIKTLIKPGIAGPKPKGKNLEMFNEFTAFYESDYKDLGYNVKIDGSNLSQILMYMESDILKNIENNIRMHFMSYVNRFLTNPPLKWWDLHKLIKALSA